MDSSTGRHEKTTPKSWIPQPGGMKKQHPKCLLPLTKNLRTEKQKNKTEFFSEVNFIAQYCHEFFYLSLKKASAYTMLYNANHLENRNPIK